MNRRTKIVATLGPATDNESQLESLLLAGVNVVRLNFSHGDAEDHLHRAAQVRKIAKQHDLFVAIMGDLQGPKIRIARFADGPITLNTDDEFTLDAELALDKGNQTQVGLDYPALISDCSPGDILLLDDGRVELEVTEKNASQLKCRVIQPGILSNNKGINRKNGGLSAPALTEKDFRDIQLAAQIGVDYLAVSFPRSADDIETARQSLRDAGSGAGIVAKIERAEAVNDHQRLDQIISASDAVMVARGDLGVEIGDAALIGVQKHIIDRAQHLNRSVITATQMMESMITNPLPTRAEVFDVANAVLDGTDAVMLSAESAAGQYPIEAVEAMGRIIVGAEQQDEQRQQNHLSNSASRIDETIALAAISATRLLPAIKAIVCMTESGRTPLLMSRSRGSAPIFAFTRHPKTQHKVSLYRGVQTIAFDSDRIASCDINQHAVEILLRRGEIKKGDLVLLTKGDYHNVHGGTNTLKLVIAGEQIH